MSVRKRLLAFCATSAVLLSMVVGTASPSAAATVPDVPTNVSASPGNASTVVSWSAPVSDGGSTVTGYTVTLQPGDKMCSTTVGVTENPLTCTVSSLTNGTAYSVYVVARNVVGDGPGGLPSVVSYPLGLSGPGGGVIFYDAGSEQAWGRYLEAAPASWSGGADPVGKWCNVAVSTGASGASVGSGQVNTGAAVAACSTGAARLAVAYRGGAFTDWFLPSKDELNLLRESEDVVGGFDTVGTYPYWSSSEASSTNTWAQSFDAVGSAPGLVDTRG